MSIAINGVNAYPDTYGEIAEAFLDLTGLEILVVPQKK